MSSPRRRRCSWPAVAVLGFAGCASSVDGLPGSGRRFVEDAAGPADLAAPPAPPADAGASSEDATAGGLGLPPALEPCDGYDNNRDGRVDEHCLCAAGVVEPCFLGAPGADRGLCVRGTHTCDVTALGEFFYWSACVGSGSATPEICGNGLDEDCDGVDELCPPPPDCYAGEVVECYTGPAGTMGRGACHAGTSACTPAGAWGACSGEGHPGAEVCDDAVDNDCDGETDEGCVSCHPVPESCGDGVDNDCDGSVDCGDSDCAHVGSCDPCSVASQGRYGGGFLGAVTVLVGFAPRIFHVEGLVTFRLEQRDGPGTLEVVSGDMNGLAEGRYLFRGRVEGSLDCVSRRFTARMVDANVNVGVYGSYDFEGDLTADYNTSLHSLVGGVWSGAQTGGGPAWGGRGLGVWAAAYLGF